MNHEKVKQVLSCLNPEIVNKQDHGLIQIAGDKEKFVVLLANKLVEGELNGIQK